MVKKRETNKSSSKKLKIKAKIKKPKTKLNRPKTPKSKTILTKFKTKIQDVETEVQNIETKFKTKIQNAEIQVKNIGSKLNKPQTKETDEEPTGQFLITYSWAILVIIAAIVILIYSAFSSSGGIVIQKCSISRSSGLSCDSFNITSESITLHIKNSLDENLVITKLSQISYKNNSCKLNADSLILAKNTTSLIFNTAGSIGTCKALLANSKIKAKINITFKDINLTSKTATGKLVAKT